MAGHAVNRDPALFATVEYTFTQTHRKTVVGIGGGVQTVTRLERPRVFFGIGPGVGCVGSPGFAGLLVSGIAPTWLKIAVLSQRNPASLGGFRVLA